MDRLIDGRYAILDELGSGGMGSVFRVRDQLSGRVVALKILAAEGERRRERLLRFRREFRAAAGIRHPNVVEVYEFVSGRLSYFTMEYVEGKPLAAWFGLGERRPPPAELNQPERIRQLFSALHQILLALEVIHERHIVHRDLKPENLLVREARAGAERVPLVKLMDFGLARDLRETVALTQPGTVLGTLSYISPELAAGRAIDGRSDLYALGVLLYLLLTGAVPFGPDVASNVLWKHCSQTPEPPRHRNPGVHRFLESVCLKLLKKDPFDRYQTARELLRLVEKAGRGTYALPDEVVAAATASEPAAGQLFTPRLSGRESAVGRLLDGLEAALEGRGSSILVLGPPGSGRSRLLEAAGEAARAAGAQVFTAAADPADPRPYGALRPWLEGLRRALAGMPEIEAAAVAGPDAALLARIDPRLAELRPVGREDPSREQDPAGPERFAAALGRCFGRLARRAPVVLALDDADRADEASRACLRALVAEVAASAASGRSLDPSIALWSSGVVRPDPVAAGPFELEVPLGPLGLAHTTLLVQSMLGHDAVAGPLIEPIHAAAAGAPAVVEELVRLAVAEGVLRTTGGRWSASPERVEAFAARIGAAGGAAAALERAIASRAESAGPTGLALLRAIVLLPRATSFEVLVQAAGLEEGAAIDAVEMLLRAQLAVEGEGAARVDVAGARARAWVNGGIDLECRRAVHARAAAALAQLPGPDPVLVLYHAWNGEDAGRARAWLAPAAAALERVGATDEADRWRRRLATQAG